MTLPAHLESAFTEIERVKEPLWAVTIKHTNKRKHSSRTSRYDPGKNEGEQWALLKIDDRDPTSQEQHDFHQKKNLKQESKPKKEESGLPNLSMEMPAIRDVITPATLTLKAEKDDKLIYFFRPVIDHMLLRGLMKHIDGELIFNKETESIDTISIRSNGKFTAFPSVTIKEMSGQMIFQRLASSGDLVLQETNYRVTGKKLFVSKIHEEGMSVYSDYEPLEKG